jgi:flagellar hook-associated protein 2
METAVRDDFEQVAELLAGDKGVFKDYRSYLNTMTSSRDGIFAARKQTTDSMMKRIDKDIERMESRMERREEFLLKRFTAMEQMVNMFNAQSEFLTNQMDRMPVFGRKK